MKEALSLYPLTEFYALAKMPLPFCREVSRENIPMPQQRLLVYKEDMTPTLEEYYSGEITLQLHHLIRREGYILRQVALMCNNEKAVVFGAIHINLYLFPAPAQEGILACRQPLGAILRDHRIPHRSDPQAFFKIKSDFIINRAFNISGVHTLYGRINQLLNRFDQPLVEVVEILPPAETANQGPDDAR